MVHHPIKEPVLLICLKVATFNWASSSYKCYKMNITLLTLAYFCTTQFGTWPSLYITLYFVVVSTFVFAS